MATDYSNLGAAVLGQALSQRSGMEYEGLLRARITAPLGMTKTAVALTDGMRSQLAIGHHLTLERAPYYDLGAMAPAGGLHSDADDLLAFLEAVELGYFREPPPTSDGGTAVGPDTGYRVNLTSRSMR